MQVVVYTTELSSGNDLANSFPRDNNVVPTKSHDYYYTVVVLVILTLVLQVVSFGLGIALLALKYPDSCPPGECPPAMQKMNDALTGIGICVVILQVVRVVLDGIGDEHPCPSPAYNTTACVDLP
ncbi:hypothetical protein CAPTEDRAFT_186336 [Capitella teleta]|uniref:Uncharacterized protein n=1 Tax=Capitella teleta TaxID=283909 RepID=R7VLS7_CAPTE|nr:hypothetical protein CAPTEDRAFT_186336 [Capitella teleta]|eukprot:ELU17870.1 hypothetical protein CAPTEDRAFT_186336 [Capitella teleta]